MKIETRHYSGINFDWIMVRELRFSDSLDRREFLGAKDLTANVQVDVSLNESKTVCRTLLRLTLDPPGGESDQFKELSAAVEGQFSVAEGAVPSVDLGAFAHRQAAAILMPFLREAVARATTGSRFGQVLVPPINVVALMQEIDRERAAAAHVSQPPAAPST